MEETLPLNRSGVSSWSAACRIVVATASNAPIIAPATSASTNPGTWTRSITANPYPTVDQSNTLPRRLLLAHDPEDRPDREQRAGARRGGEEPEALWPHAENIQRESGEHHSIGTEKRRREVQTDQLEE